METGNPIYITILDDYFTLPKITKRQQEENTRIWESLFDQYLQTFGLSEQSQKFLNWEKKIALMQCQMLARQDWAMQAAINIETKKMRDEISKLNDTTIEETTAFLEQHRKQTIDQFKCSVKMYYTYVNLMNKEAKRAKSRNLAKQK